MNDNMTANLGKISAWWSDLEELFGKFVNMPSLQEYLLHARYYCENMGIISSMPSMPSHREMAGTTRVVGAQKPEKQISTKKKSIF